MSLVLTSAVGQFIDSICNKVLNSPTTAQWASDCTVYSGYEVNNQITKKEELVVQIVFSVCVLQGLTGQPGPCGDRGRTGAKVSREIDIEIVNNRIVYDRIVLDTIILITE